MSVGSILNLFNFLKELNKIVSFCKFNDIKNKPTRINYSVYQEQKIRTVKNE
jgi:hypothetical protein